jgi:hypothetical protein
LKPIVRHLIACEDIVVHPDRPNDATLVNILTNLKSDGFPARHPEICVFVLVTDCRGNASVRIQIEYLDTGEIVFRTRSRRIDFGSDPLEVTGLRYRLRDCVFPRPGMYAVRFYCDDELIHEQPLRVS